MSASITPRQMGFIKSLLTERADQLKIDVDAFIEAQSISTLTAKGASDLIDNLKKMPVALVAKPEHAHLPASATRIIVNNYAKPCQLCGHEVLIGTGHAVQVAGSWQTFHAMQGCTTGVLTVVEAKKAYRLTDGTICIAYTTQNNRLAVRRLDIGESGKGALNYWSGGLARVRSEGTLLTAEEASALGRTYGFCILCCRDLTDDRSLAVGYGATCADNNNWWYPSAKEAQEMLKRPTSL